MAYSEKIITGQKALNEEGIKVPEAAEKAGIPRNTTYELLK